MYGSDHIAWKTFLWLWHHDIKNIFCVFSSRVIQGDFWVIGYYRPFVLVASQTFINKNTTPNLMVLGSKVS